MILGVPADVFVRENMQGYDCRRMHIHPNGHSCFSHMQRALGPGRVGLITNASSEEAAGQVARMARELVSMDPRGFFW